MEQRKTVYLSFSVDKFINLHEQSFSVSVCQQGDRLGKCRPTTRSDRFEPTTYSIVLLSSEGELIDAGFDNRCQFFYSLQTKRPILDKGNYIIIIDAIWNKSAHFDPQYKHTLVDLYGPQIYNLQEIQEDEAMKALEKALKAAAKKLPPTKRTFYR